MEICVSLTISSLLVSHAVYWIHVERIVQISVGSPSTLATFEFENYAYFYIIVIEVIFQKPTLMNSMEKDKFRIFKANLIVYVLTSQISILSNHGDLIS